MDPRPLSAREIVAGVATLMGTTFAEITGPRRPRDLTDRRHRAVFVLAQLRPDMSDGEIGRVFGGRDHSTIHYSRTKIEAAMSQPATAAEVSALMAAVKDAVVAPLTLEAAIAEADRNVRRAHEALMEAQLRLDALKAGREALESMRALHRSAAHA